MPGPPLKGSWSDTQPVQSREEVGMKQRHPHILNASVNLLSICFIVIGGLQLTDRNASTFADEAAKISAVALFVSTLMSYWAIREEEEPKLWHHIAADWSFLFGPSDVDGSSLHLRDGSLEKPAFS